MAAIVRTGYTFFIRIVRANSLGEAWSHAHPLQPRTRAVVICTRKDGHKTPNSRGDTLILYIFAQMIPTYFEAVLGAGLPTWLRCYLHLS
jgi:hypothetical protein